MERTDFALARFGPTIRHNRVCTKVPEGNGELLIFCHPGTANRFVPNCLLAFKSKKTTEYHEEVNYEQF
uniref:SFRICE_040128 n=1 Tax=Spodoptera frugiperda TaxID=7108 RepID=A0A2H1V925_SPOFR